MTTNQEVVRSNRTDCAIFILPSHILFNDILQPMSSDKKDILKALDKMEAQSEEINKHKSRVETYVKKHVKPKTELTREEILKQKHNEQKLQEGWSNRTRLVTVAFVCVGLVIFLYMKTKGDGVNFVFYVIAAVCFYGFYLMAMNSRK